MTESKVKLLLSVYSEPNRPIMAYEKSGYISGVTVARAADSLIAKGLLEERREDRPPRRRMLQLTIWGSKVAPLILEEDVIEQAQKHSEARTR